MGIRYQSIASKDVFTTVSNTDIFTDITIAHDGILRIGFEGATVMDMAITLDGTAFTTIGSKTQTADIWTFIEVPVEAGDVFNMQTVGTIEIVSIRVLLISSNERD